MLRLTGMLTGAALAVAFLIVAVGLPVLSPPEPAVATTVVAPPVEAETVEPVLLANTAEPPAGTEPAAMFAAP